MKSLQIKNFRALEDVQIENLGNINLIVGKNNSGKSSVLEALRIYAGRGNLPLLAEIASSHDERYDVPDAEHNESTTYPFESFFTGRKFPLDDRGIVIGEIDSIEEQLEISHLLILETEETISDSDGDEMIRVKREVITKDRLAEGIHNSQAISVKRNGKARQISLDTAFDRPYNRRPRFMQDPSDIIPCSFVPTQFVSIDELADLWDKVLFTSQEDYVKIGLRSITPEFENLAFVKSETDQPPSYINRTRRDISRIAKVKLENLPYPIPLNSMGDGIVRVLQLILKAFPAKGGMMLIDEFENGLHFSVQVKIWNLLFRLAKELDIQIFASTHSWDCIESFVKATKEAEGMSGTLFRVGKSVRNSDNGKTIVTVYQGEKLYGITQNEVEVR